jgi:carbon-monoxide dehydrogenase medium subunit
MKPVAFDYRRPASLDEALALLKGNDGSIKLIAGGQSLGPMLNLRMVQPTLLVDIARLKELAGVAETADGLTIGAAVRHAAIEDGEVPDVANGLLRRVAGGIAYRAVRNRGTIGGSLSHADPAGDWAPAMMALDAVVIARGGAGTREIAAGKFVAGPLATALEPDEIAQSVRVPRLSADARWGHVKLCRKPGEFAESLAVVVIDRARKAIRAVVTSPRHAPAYLAGTAQLIDGLKGWSADAEQKVKEAVAADLKALKLVGDDAYRLQIHRATVARAAREALS